MLETPKVHVIIPVPANSYSNFAPYLREINGGRPICAPILQEIRGNIFGFPFIPVEQDIEGGEFFRIVTELFQAKYSIEIKSQTLLPFDRESDPNKFILVRSLVSHLDNYFQMDNGLNVPRSGDLIIHNPKAKRGAYRIDDSVRRVGRSNYERPVNVYTW